MVQTYIYVAEGLNLGHLDDIPDDVKKAAFRAVNRTATRARTMGGRAIRLEAALPARYLSSEDGRLQISAPANAGRLERTVTGRRRPTSLARYVTGESKRKGLRVTVKPGSAKYLKRGFLIPLRGAGGGTSNKGLAIRTSDGLPPRGALKPKKLGDNLYLLYGLSVDVLFARVVGPLTPQVADELAVEFNRLLDLDGF